MMKKLQKLGKALMLPVAALPICGIRSWLRDRSGRYGRAGRGNERCTV